MEYTGKFDINEARQYISKIGEAIEPSDEEAKRNWEGMCKYLSPRMFLLVTEVKTEKLILSHGFDELGYHKGFPHNKDAFISIHHENHRALVKIQAYYFYGALVQYPKLVGNNKFIFTATKGLYDANGKAWLVSQTSTPFQFDSKGLISRFLSTYRIIKEYEGEPFLSDIAYKPKYDKVAKKALNLIRDLRMDMLPILGFTNQQIKIIEMLSLNKLTTKEIAKELEISPRTVDNHNRNILQRAKIIFPLNNFEFAQDVAEYLSKHKIV